MTRGRGTALLAGGGILAAIGASSCCVIPFLLLTAGAGGAWIGNLTTLAPYQPIFLALALAFLAAGFVLVHRRREAACGAAEACARPASERVVTAGLWAGAALVVAALAFPYVAPLVVDL